MLGSREIVTFGTRTNIVKGYIDIKIFQKVGPQVGNDVTSDTVNAKV